MFNAQRNQPVLQDNPAHFPPRHPSEVYGAAEWVEDLIDTSYAQCRWEILNYLWTYHFITFTTPSLND